MSRQEATPQRRARLEDIAKRCRVSTSTVSRALSGQKGVRAEVAQRVLEAARLAHYPLANPLAGRRVIVAASAAAMVDYGRTQFSWLVLEGLRAGANAESAEIVPLALPNGAKAKDALEQALADREAAGLILLTVDDVALLDLVHERSWNTVLVNCEDPWMRFSSICPCNRSAARLGADYLLDRRHTAIGFVARLGRQTIQRRLEGWRDALEARDLPVDDSHIITVGDWVPKLAEAAILERIDAGDFPFTALLCAGDSLAIGVMNALAVRGLGVPDDVSVIGIDDLPVLEFVKPRLTTMHIPATEIGMQAFKLLHEQSGEPERVPRRIELACRLVHRDSVAARKTA